MVGLSILILLFAAGTVIAARRWRSTPRGEEGTPSFEAMLIGSVFTLLFVVVGISVAIGPSPSHWWLLAWYPVAAGALLVALVRRVRLSWFEKGVGLANRFGQSLSSHWIVLLSARRDDLHAGHSATRLRRIGPRRLMALCMLFVLSAVLTQVFAREEFDAQFVSLAFGLSFVSVLFLGSMPVLIVWWAITFWSGFPDFRSTLQRASDHAGRGLTLGFLIGTTALMGGIIASTATGADPIASLDRLVAFSLAGTVAGFATAHAAVLDHACRRAPVPALAWLAAPPAVLLLLVVEVHLVGDPTVIFDALVRGLTSGLAPVPEAADDSMVRQLVESDVRYIFLVSTAADLHEAVIGRAAVVVAITVPLATYLWSKAFHAYHRLADAARPSGETEKTTVGA